MFKELKIDGAGEQIKGKVFEIRSANIEWKLIHER